ncbi:MAG TPA: tetratricopeptide repeat protein [Fibrobacteria bacterium]|nr:tetratricopeptide repeat protein [Fibrobacteria bacterium]
MSIQYTADQLQRKFKGSPGSPGFPRLADVLRAEGRIDEAIQMCQDGLRVRPNTLSAYVVLGKALMDAGRMEDARDPFEAALRLDPRCLSAMHFLARIMTKLQLAEAAAGYYRSILELEPWDSEIRALLGETGSGPGAAAPKGLASMPAFQPPAAADTFEKPEGFSGDVLEVNLNDVAADFLPGQDADVSAAMGLSEESLEDALSEAAATVEAAAKLTEERPRPPAVPAGLPEPQPLDVFREEPAETSDETVAGDAPPISGQDVEDRLDSLFGSEDGPAASMRSQSATWTPAPVEPEASAAATGEMPVAEMGGMSAGSGDDFSGDRTTIQAGAASQSAEIGPLDLASVPDLPASEAAEAVSVGDYGAVDFVTPAPETSRAQEAGDGETEEGGRVRGEDIERRLDELFNLTEDEDRLPAQAMEATRFADPPEAGETAEEIVTGQDVADKLDNLFGAEPSAKTEFRETVPGPSPESAPAPFAGTASGEAVPDTDAPDDAMPEAAAPAAAVHPESPLMSTESITPPGWFGEAGDGPGITGADVEDQLDKLFRLDQDGETGRPVGPRAGRDDADIGDAATFTAPGAGAGGDADMTVIMPALRDPSPAEDVRLPKDGGRIKESVADWLARRNEEADPRSAPDPKSADEAAAREAAFLDAVAEAGETMILPNEDVAAAGEDADAFGTLAPEDMPALPETASVEMVDGVDVAERLDALFADEGAAGKGVLSGSAGLAAEAPASGTEMSLFLTEDGDALDTVSLEDATGEGVVSGEDVSSRLDALFETSAVPKEAVQDAAPTETGVPAGMETGEELPAMTSAANAPAQAAPELAPMTDEEDGYPEEEEMPSGTGAGANVATVTLAEIYFQQGLREQALQIYRQLLEREPENESVRKRIEEIEAAKPEGEEPGPGSDPRRPRPGLKVPKRKK